MHWLNLCEVTQAPSLLAPSEKLSSRPIVRAPGVGISDADGKELQEANRSALTAAGDDGWHAITTDREVGFSLWQPVRGSWRPITR